ncbi:YvaD family protein [Paenibacillus xylaniclasticus]|uniref:YvaD family protein n=1 Tax=Paenibacillus xylaniclasticus TaxID=588083 RepID=UPI000FDAE705|nr:YvaD family protein [Paenibacillus xylaniclasticus]
MKWLKPLFWVTDIGFIAYWLVTFFHIIPDEYAFKDYNISIMVDWNWSFFPLDILISITGLTSLYYHKRNRHVWKHYALISLVLTFCSGLQAIAFWAFSGDFDLIWWAVNLYLLLYPIFFIVGFLRKLGHHPTVNDATIKRYMQQHRS